MVKNGEKATIREILKDYELPVKIKKPAWFGNFYFVIEEVKDEKVYGSAYRNGLLHTRISGKDYSYNLDDIVVLYGDDNLRKNIAEFEIDEEMDVENIYAQKPTMLRVKRNGEWKEAEFKKIDKRNDKPVTVVEVEGEGKEVFFPLGSNFVDMSPGGKEKQRKEIKSINKVTSDKINYFLKKPKSRPSDDNYDEELKYEKEYHAEVDKKLDLMFEEAGKMLHSDDISERVFDAEWFFDAYSERYQKIDSLGSIDLLNKNRLDEQQSTIRNKVKIEPYKGRLDFGRNMDELHTVYVGLYDIDGYAVDWRNKKIADVWNNTEIYLKAKDATIGLKRIFSFSNSNLESFSDEVNIYNNGEIDYEKVAPNKLADPFLINIIQSNRKNRQIQDIVSSIQNNQYEIIVSDFNSNILVNGCAGSGKTMIMYHRLSYLAYNDANNFKSNNVYAITPSELFSSLFNKLTEDLRIPEINNLSYINTIDNIIDRYSLDNNLVITEVKKTNLDRNTENYSEFLDAEKYKEFQDNLYMISEKTEEFSNWFISYINSDLKNNDIDEITDAEFYRTLALNKDLGAIIDNRIRGSRFTKKGKPHEVKDQKGRIITIQDEKYIPRELASYSLENVRYTVKDNEGLEKRIKAYENAMEHLLGTKVKMGNDGPLKVQNDYMKSERMFSASLTLLNLEKALRGFQKFFVDHDDSSIFLYMCKFACVKTLGENYPRYIEKVYTLNALALKYGNLTEERVLLFLDEFQNYSEFEINTLKKPFNNFAMNLYGDFDQRMENKGAELDYFNREINVNSFELNENYRNAMEITEYINTKLNKCMLPIGIHGSVLEKNIDDCVFKLDGRTAIISDLDYNLVKKLVEDKIDKNSELLNDDGMLDYERFNIINVHDCKGLEFDTVYVLDMNMSNNEKYVAYTRALSNLIIINNTIN